MTEAMVVLVLARRDRVDALRPFAPHATGDRNAQFHTERERQLVFKPSRYLPAPWTEQQLSQFDQLSLAAHHSLPGFDLFKPDQGYNLHARLGNTGAASPFVQWALAAIAAHHQQNASLTVNPRRSDEATITAITPSPHGSNLNKTNPLDFKLAP
jgi:hypothetical protein